MKKYSVLIKCRIVFFINFKTITLRKTLRLLLTVQIAKSSVVDPDPDPWVFEHSGSGSLRQRFRSGFGSFNHQAKIVRETLIPTVL
jgi:hypothetical protein